MVILKQKNCRSKTPISFETIDNRERRANCFEIENTVLSVFNA